MSKHNNNDDGDEKGRFLDVGLAQSLQPAPSRPRFSEIAQATGERLSFGDDNLAASFASDADPAGNFALDQAASPLSARRRRNAAADIQRRVDRQARSGARNAARIAAAEGPAATRAVRATPSGPRSAEQRRISRRTAQEGRLTEADPPPGFFRGIIEERVTEARREQNLEEGQALAESTRALELRRPAAVSRAVPGAVPAGGPLPDGLVPAGQPQPGARFLEAETLDLPPSAPPQQRTIQSGRAPAPLDPIDIAGTRAREKAEAEIGRRVSENLGFRASVQQLRDEQAEIAKAKQRMAPDGGRRMRLAVGRFDSRAAHQRFGDLERRLAISGRRPSRHQRKQLQAFRAFQGEIRAFEGIERAEKSNARKQSQARGQAQRLAALPPISPELEERIARAGEAERQEKARRTELASEARATEATAKIAKQARTDLLAEVKQSKAGQALMNLGSRERRPLLNQLVEELAEERGIDLTGGAKAKSDRENLAELDVLLTAFRGEERPKANADFEQAIDARTRSGASRLSRADQRRLATELQGE